METKKELREEIKKNLKSISKKTFDDWSLSLSKNLFEYLQTLSVIQEKKLIGCFSPFQNEPQWDLSFSDELGDKLKDQRAYPSISAIGQEQMVFKKSNHDELVLKKDFGVSIYGPEENREMVQPEIILIPGIAFTKSGKRLGRGKGYYDRYLETFKGIAIGVCFECQLKQDVPTSVFDKNVKIVITEKKIYITNEGEL